MSKLLLATSAILFLGCAETRIDETYLIPRGYTGQIAIVFGVEQGEKEVLENGRRVYHIPEDGILLTQSKFNDTWHNKEYFLVEGGKRVAIPFTEPEEFEKKGLGENDVFACCGGASRAGNEYSYALVYVGTPKAWNARPKSYVPDLEFHDKVRRKLERALGRKLSGN